MCVLYYLVTELGITLMAIGKDRKRITSYVPIDLYEIVESVQSKNNYSQSQAIEVILRYFRDNWSGDTLPSLPSESPVTVEQVERLIDEKLVSVINSDTLSKLEKVNSVIDSDILSKLKKVPAFVDEHEAILKK